MAKTRILVIDDEDIMREFVEETLLRAGYEVDTAASGRVGLDALSERGFDLVVTDLKMTPMDGLEVLRAVCESSPTTGCIVMTAYPDLDSATETMRRGTCDYIAKPFKKEDLVASVDRAAQRMGIIYTDEHELIKLIGQRIRTQRLSLNLTLRQLSDRTDLTTSQLSQVELGKNAASIWALARISNSLGLQVSELLNGL